MSFEVKIDVFEGPFDLLLQLIMKQELDIHFVPIAQITASYLDNIEGTVELDLDSATEFILIAATLLLIKARSLLPGAYPRTGSFSGNGTLKIALDMGPPREFGPGQVAPGIARRPRSSVPDEGHRRRPDRSLPDAATGMMGHGSGFGKERRADSGDIFARGRIRDPPRAVSGCRVTISAGGPARRC